MKYERFIPPVILSEATLRPPLGRRVAKSKNLMRYQRSFDSVRSSFVGTNSAQDDIHKKFCN